MFTIKSLKGRQIFDSRGNPTIEADIEFDCGAMGRASVPSGASVGSNEAIELRDRYSKRYCGMGVSTAVRNINQQLAVKLVGQRFTSQQTLDEFLIATDGTNAKSNLGANAILAVSIAFAKAMAAALKQPLFKSIANGAFILKIPIPMFNIINGGVHASNSLDIQEFMIIPMVSDIVTAMEMGMTVFHTLKKLLHHKHYSTNVGDEGGFAPELTSAEEALDLIMQAIEDAGLIPGKNVCLALDIAATELYNGNGCYYWPKEKRVMDRTQIMEYYISLISNYPVISIEDPFAEDDLMGWSMLTQAIGNKVQLVGDDLFVTNATMIQQGIEHGIANALLVKMNQIGTISETIQAIDLALQNGYTTVVSHRSGETEDTTIAHLAVATGSKYIKSGSLCRTDRVCKYNELLRINELLAD